MKVQILVVDDEPEIRAMLSRHYRYLGYEVNTAAHGREALDSLALAKTDIVITDIKMPVMDGIELLDGLLKDEEGAAVLKALEELKELAVDRETGDVLQELLENYQALTASSGFDSVLRELIMRQVVRTGRKERLENGRPAGKALEA